MEIQRAQLKQFHLKHGIQRKKIFDVAQKQNKINTELKSAPGLAARIVVYADNIIAKRASIEPASAAHTLTVVHGIISSVVQGAWEILTRLASLARGLTHAQGACGPRRSIPSERRPNGRMTHRGPGHNDAS